MGNCFLQARRLFLRPLTFDDAAAVFRYRSDPEVRRFQSWRPSTLEEVEEFLRTRLAAEPDLPETWFQFAICRNEPMEILGDCGLHFLSAGSQQVEVGITLAPEQWGKGYATEVLDRVFHYLFEELGKHRIIASVDPHNRASIRLLERMKMRREAHFVESIRDGDRWVDDVVYAILAREWTE
ncbi:MAG: GNAT family N-acetyltransferase [Bacteroidota bacterium]